MDEPVIDWAKQYNLVCDTAMNNLHRAERAEAKCSALYEALRLARGGLGVYFEECIKNEIPMPELARVLQLIDKVMGSSHAPTTETVQ